MLIRETGTCCLGDYFYGNLRDICINALKGDDERGLSVNGCTKANVNASVIFFTSASYWKTVTEKVLNWKASPSWYNRTLEINIYRATADVLPNWKVEKDGRPTERIVTYQNIALYAEGKFNGELPINHLIWKPCTSYSMAFMIWLLHAWFALTLGFKCSATINQKQTKLRINCKMQWNGKIVLLTKLWV